MKLKTSVAAVILAFSATGAWAGPTGTDQSRADMGTPDATAVQPAAGAVNEQLEWKFVNGQAAASEDQGGKDQAATSKEQSGSDQTAKSEEQDGSDQTAKSEDQSGDEQAATEDDSGDQTANSEEQGDDDRSAMTEDEGEENDQAAGTDDDGRDQAARSEDQDESDRSANSDNPAADLKDKVVVIIPKGWKGSIPDLVAALEKSPDAKDIVIVQQGEPQASSDEPDDSYSASNKPVINQQ